MFRSTRKKIVDKIATRHIAGPSIDDALLVCRWADENGINTNIEPWTFSDDSPRIMVKQYSEAIETILDTGYNCTLGVKPACFNYDTEVFKDLIWLASVKKIRIHLGSTDLASAQRNFALLERVTPSYTELGCTLPSRWLRSLDDTKRVIDLGLYVRVVKGQWVDPDAPRLNCKTNYLDVVSRLVDKSRFVGVATHDVRLARSALNLLSSSSTEHEMEQFFSLPLNGLNLSKEFSCPYRIHVAYGNPGLPYNVRFGPHRPATIAWVISDILRKRPQPWAKDTRDPI